tara:strand:- start:1671 stop:3011 length:1341 start_codon:yes stop_codon:yes gene_type:complete
MALLAETKGFNSPNEDATESVSLTSAHWGSESPKFHLIAGSGSSADQVTNDMKSTIGFGSASEEVAIGIASQDASSSTITDRAHQTAFSAYALNTGGAVYESASLDSYSAATVTLDWTNTSPDAANYFLMALGGDDLEDVSIDQITTSTLTGDVSYTGPGFEPDFLICLGTAGNSLPYTSNHMACQIGISDGATDAGIYAVSLDGRSSASVTFSVMSDNFIHLTGGFGSDTTRATVKSLDSSGYTLNYNLAGAATRVTIIAVKGPRAKVVTTTQPESDTTNDLDAGFVPSAGICIGAMKTASQTASDHNRFTLGAWTDNGGSNHMDSIGWMDEDSQATSDVDRYISNACSIKNYDHDQTVAGQATVAVQGNGIRETWTQTNGTEYAHAWLILGGAPVVTPPGHSGRIDAGQVCQDGTVAGMTAQAGISAGAVYQSKTSAGQIIGAT